MIFLECLESKVALILKGGGGWVGGDRHRLPKTQLLKTLALLFCVGEKNFENGAFRKPAGDCRFCFQIPPFQLVGILGGGGRGKGKKFCRRNL